MAASPWCGCSQGAPPPPARTPAAPPTIKEEPELESLDRRAVTQALGVMRPQLVRCHLVGRRRIPFLAGNVRFAVRINAQGKGLHGHLVESTLGDDASERCLLDVLTGGTWPPSTGEVEVRDVLELAAGGEPAPWGPGKVLDSVTASKAMQRALRACKADGSLNLTAYVVPAGASSPTATDPRKPSSDRNEPGKFLGVGAAASTKESAAKASCVIAALKALALPNPGGYAAKVSLDL